MPILGAMRFDGDPHPFYRLPTFVQWPVSMIGVWLALVPLALCAGAMLSGALRGEPTRVLMGLAAVPLVAWPTFSAFVFASSPLFVRLGTYHYVSPTLLYLRSSSSDVLELHTGTSFDWIPLMWRQGVGGPLRRAMLVDALSGLLAMVNAYERGELDGVVVGESWFFNASTATRLGFTVEVPSRAGRNVFLLGYLDLAAMASLTAGRLRLPRYANLKRVRAPLSRIAQERASLERLLARLRRDGR